MENDVRERLAKYADSRVGVSTTEKEEINRLILENVDIAKEVIMTNDGGYGSSDNRIRMVLLLIDNGLGEEVALYEAQRLANKLNFYRCMPRVGRMVKNWLACKTDEIPREWPKTENILGYRDRIEAREVCYMSKLNEFMARSLVYAIMAGYPDYFREPLKYMLEIWGLEYTRKFLDDMVERYQVNEVDVIEMYSIGYVLPWRTKLETQLYEGYVNNWIENDWEKYLDIITKMKDRGGDLGKKVYKKVIKPRLEETH